MILDSLINPKSVNQSPWRMFLIGVLYSSIGLLVAMFVFPQYAGLLMIFFTVSASIPFVYWAIKQEESKDMKIQKEAVLLKEHTKTLASFIVMFLGFVASFTAWYVLLPADVSDDLFQIQSDTIAQINDPLAGHAYNIAGTFGVILMNNIKVMIFCLIFAFLYGFGAIFILTWNASIISVAIGEIIRNQAGNVASLVPLALARYLIHGIPEMFAFFMAGLAGGIISIAAIKHDLQSPQGKKVLLDSLDLTFGAFALLVVAALLEVFVSPLIW